jgi:hypothetical protein
METTTMNEAGNVPSTSGADIPNLAEHPDGSLILACFLVEMEDERTSTSPRLSRTGVELTSASALDLLLG